MNNSIKSIFLVIFALMTSVARKIVENSLDSMVTQLTLAQASGDPNYTLLQATYKMRANIFHILSIAQYVLITMAVIYFCKFLYQRFIKHTED